MQKAVKMLLSTEELLSCGLRDTQLYNDDNVHSAAAYVHIRQLACIHLKGLLSGVFCLCTKQDARVTINSQEN